MCEVPKKRLGYPATNPSCNQRSWHLHVPFRNRKGVNGSSKGQIAKGCGTGDPIPYCTVCGAVYAKCLMEIWHTNRIKQKTSLRRNAKCALYLFNVYLYLSIYLCLCVCVSLCIFGLGWAIHKSQCCQNGITSSDKHDTQLSIDISRFLP